MAEPPRHFADTVERNGYGVYEQTVDRTVIAELIELFNAKLRDSPGQPSQPCLRNILESLPKVRELARSQEMRQLIEPILGQSCFAVRRILFDKTPGSNWKVPWHQDLSIAVQNRIESPSFGPWSIKEGVIHVQPPIDILEHMLTVRLHLDDCFDDHGPVRVLPGSHCLGKLSTSQVSNLRAKHNVAVCTVARGGALLMRPLLLHASSAALAPSHRRVVHIEHASCELPGGLEWFSRV